MPLNGAMKIPSDDDDLRNDDHFDDDHEALFTQSRTNRRPVQLNPVVNCCLTGIASIQFLWIYRRAEFLLGLILLTCVTLALTGVIEAIEIKTHGHSHSSHFHKFSHEYDNIDIKSPLDLKLGEIDHWCLDGSDNKCPTCDDPTHPISRGEFDGWKKAFVRNKHLSMNFVENGKQPDVIFIGDSLVEATAGTLKGLKGLDGSLAAQELGDIKALYDAKFNKDGDAKYDALRLGIAGDTSPNVFWRLRQNEMEDLTPKVWWLSIGRNDMFRTKCSEEVALMGVIRVVEELLNRNDDATIVINSLLPTSGKTVLSLEGRYVKNDMWTSIKEVNTRLKRFAQKHHHVLFYDASDIFTVTKHKKLYIDKQLYVDKVHPSFEGYKKLVKGQLEFLDYIMDKREDRANSGYTKGLQPKPQIETKTETKTEAETQSNEIQDSSTTEAGEEGTEYLNYDDYYAYQGVFDTDDIFNDIYLYDDGVDDDW